MQEPMRLLMEESGCEQGEAELALQIAGNDLEKAIRTIGSILRGIFAVKGRFADPGQALYGLFLAVINAKTQEILRLHTVVSHNPAVYETTLEMDWFAMEKLIFAIRLDEGSIPETTRVLEERLKDHLLSRTVDFSGADAQGFAAMAAGAFTADGVAVSAAAEELNLAQFRQLPGTDTDQPRPVNEGAETGTVSLEVGLLEDAGGREAARLCEGDMVISWISDRRDIAHYLAHLIGGLRDGKMVPLPAVVKRVECASGECAVMLYFAPGISGSAVLPGTTRVRVIETRQQPWWKKLKIWN